MQTNDATEKASYDTVVQAQREIKKRWTQLAKELYTMAGPASDDHYLGECFGEIDVLEAAEVAAMLVSHGWTVSEFAAVFVPTDEDYDDEE